MGNHLVPNFLRTLAIWHTLDWSDSYCSAKRRILAYFFPVLSITLSVNMAPNGSIQNISMEELFDEEENYEDTEMPLGVRIFWDILFGSSIVISILGNISVLWTIIGEL